MQFKKTLTFSETNLFRLFSLGYILFVIIFALNVHPIEDNGGANPELDFYVPRAAALMRGETFPDSYRPILYLLAGSITGKVLGDRYFLGCQIISILSSYLFIYCSFMIAKIVLKKYAAWLLLVLIFINGDILQASVRAASDMLFQSFFMLILWWCLRMDMKIQKSSRDAVTLGIFFGLAYSTRYTTIFILPVLALFFWARRKNYSLKHFFAFCAATIVVITPQLILNYVQFGSPFYNENWRNLAVYYFGLGGLSWNGGGFTQYSQAYLLQEFIKNPFYFISFGAVKIVGSAAYKGLPNALFGRWDINLFFISIQKLMALAVYLSVPYIILTRKNGWGKQIRLFLVSSAIMVIISIGYTFYFSPRFILPVIPILFMFFIDGIYRLFSENRWRLAALATITVFILCGQLIEINRFIKDHVVDDLRASQWLVDHLGNVPTMGTSLFLGNHFPFQYSYLDSLTIIQDKEEYINRIYSTIRKNSPEFFIVNPVSSYGQETPKYLITAPNNDLPFLIPVKHIGSSIIFKINYDKLSP